MKFTCELCRKEGIRKEDTVPHLAHHIRKDHNIHGQATYIEMGLLRLHSDD